MAWRKPTREDLTARLSQEEQDAFSQSADFSADAVDGVISQAAAFARDAVRSGGRAGISPEDGTVPDGLVRSVLAIVIVDLLTRYAINPSEARLAAAKSAEEHLRQVAEGKIVPESYAGEAALEAKNAGPAADDGPRRTLGGGLW